MRTIRFRGKSLETGEWLFGDLLQADGKCYIMNDKQGGEVDPETVGQYTGREDDDGSDIYDGDIIRDRYMNCYEVIYSDKTMSWVAHSKTPFDNNIPMSVVRDCITICNKYDNPECWKEVRDESK